MKRQLVVLAMALAVRLTAQDEVKMRTMKDVRAGRVQSTGSVSGQAIYEDTGRPVRHAKILLLPEEGSDSVFAISDREGNFHIDKLAEGKYIVEIESPGCISALSFYKASELRADSDVDVTKLKDDFAEVTVAAGQQSTTTAQCKRGGAISGTVSYEDGSPAPDIHVRLLRKTDTGMQQVISGLNVEALTSNRTDDHGRFRIYGVSPGEYTIAVTEPSSQNNNRDLMESNFFGLGDSHSISQIFYGDVTSLKRLNRSSSGLEKSGTMPMSRLSRVSSI